LSEKQPRLVPTQLAALAAGVGEATIRKWASRGRITRYGTSRRAMYDLDELLALPAQNEDGVPEEWNESLSQ
jgi:hypothetical protein